MKNMAILNTLKEKITKVHIISIILAILFFISPLYDLSLGNWMFTIDFIHESGHTYFDLLFGDPSTTISINPPSTHIMRSGTIYIYALILLGGIVFTSIFLLTLISLIFLIFKYKKWYYRKSVNLGTDTIGFQINVFLFSTFLRALIPNIIPQRVYNGSYYALSDGGQLFIDYFHIPWLITGSIISIMYLFLVLFLVLSYILLISNCFYCIIKTVDTKYKILANLAF